MASIWQIRMLGGLTAERSGCVPLKFRTQQTGVLLGLLAFHAGKQHPRDALAELLWPQRDADSGRHNVRQALTSLRRQLEPPGVAPGSVLASDNVSVTLNQDAVQVDAHAFLSAVGAFDDAVDDEERLKLAAHAIELYHGDLLPGATVDWALTLRERLAQDLERLLQTTVKMLAHRGEGEAALALALRAAQAAPNAAWSHHHVVRLLVEMGRLPEARRHLEIADRQVYADESDRMYRALRTLAQKHELRRAQAPARRRRPSLAAGEPAAAPAAQPAPGTRDAGIAAGSGFPHFLTTLFGRDEELRRLEELCGSCARLVTLIGPAGVGKTRLAAEASVRLQDRFGSSRFFVALAPIDDAALVDEAVLVAAGGAARPGAPPLDSAAALLAGRDALLVFDNAEHVAESVAAAAEALLARLPGLRILTTSRRALGVAGETLLHVAPLSVPLVPDTPERLVEHASIRMFIDRARSGVHDFQVTARNAPALVAVCQRLDGLPLAIELAAARAQNYTPAQMLVELSGDPLGFLKSRRRAMQEHHETLLRAVRWSAELLDAGQRAAFARLSVFRGGWTSEAAQAVCEVPDVADRLEELLDRSLITTEEIGDERRYGMLLTLREFASTLLTQEERSALAERHALYYAALGDGAYFDLASGRCEATCRRLDAEMANITAAVEADVDPGTRLWLAGSVWRLWSRRGAIREARRWLQIALAGAAGIADARRARALNGLAHHSYRLGMLAEAEAAARESVDLCSGLDAPQEMGDGLLMLGTSLYLGGGYAAARPILQESLEARVQAGDGWGEAAALNGLAMCAGALGETERALELYATSSRRSIEVGDHELAALVSLNRASVLSNMGEYSAALIPCEQCLAALRSAGNPYWVAAALHNLGEVLVRLGRHREGLERLAEALAMETRAAGPIGIAEDLATAGVGALGLGFPAEAAMLTGLAQRLRRECGTPARVRSLLEADLAAIQAALPGRAYEAAIALGETLRVEQCQDMIQKLIGSSHKL